jgi:hypothetical protein
MKRLLVHVAGFNLGLLMRTILGYGTPRQYAEAASAAISALLGILARLWTGEFRFGRIPTPTRAFSPEVSAPRPAAYRRPSGAICSTAC